MSGTNGLRPIENLADRQKCAESPTKKKFATADEAWDEAHRRTASSGIKIAPYACASCGSLHLTRKVDGSDVLTRQAGGKVLTGAQRARGRNHPAYASVPERVTLPEPESTEPPIPGNKDARLKVLRAWLSDEREPTTIEVVAHLGGNPARDTVRDLMREVGYRNTGGRSARWVKAATAPVPPQEPAEATNGPWSDVDAETVLQLVVGDLRAAYAAIGMDMRIEVRPRG